MCKNIICAVDVDKKILLFVIFGLNYIDIVFGSVRELYYLLLFDIVSFPICIFVFVWSEKRPQNIVWSVLVTKKSTFAQVWSSVTSIQGENFKYKVIWNILNEQCTVTIDYADGVVEEWWKWQEYSEYPLNRCLTV